MEALVLLHTLLVAVTHAFALADVVQGVLLVAPLALPEMDALLLFVPECEVLLGDLHQDELVDEVFFLEGQDSAYKGLQRGAGTRHPRVHLDILPLGTNLMFYLLQS